MILRNQRARSSYGHSHTQAVRQMMAFDENQQIRLNDLRHKRKQLENKLKMVSNRIGYKKKKEQEELRKLMRSEEQIRNLSDTKHFKKFNKIIREQISQKKIFESQKKAKQVQDFRMTNNRRLSLINQALKDRKHAQSQKQRMSKRHDSEIMEFSKHEALQMKKERRQQIHRLHQRQQVRRKCFWLEKKINYEQQLANEAELYERQIQQYYRRIQQVRGQEMILREQQEKAAEALKSAQQNYSLLRQS